MKDDTIKRSDAVGVVQKRLDSPYMQNAWQQGACLSILRAIEEIPSADRPQGEWIYNGNFCGMNHHKCSVCGRTEFRMSAYCPNCGARMKGTGDEAN